MEVAKQQAPALTDMMKQAVEKADEFIELNIKTAFRTYDSDNSGLIDIPEFTALMASLGHVLSRDEIAAALRTVDKNDDGFVDYNEFQNWYMRSLFQQESGSNSSAPLLNVGHHVQKIGDAMSDSKKISEFVSKQDPKKKVKMVSQKLTVNLNKVNTVLSSVSMRHNMSGADHKLWFKAAQDFAK